VTLDGALVLVVDDEPDVRETLRLVLERAGHRVQQAASGPEALARIREAEPDAVVLDVVMPGQDGFATLARIRDVADVPVLMLTARVAEADKLRGLGGGADDYVTKPFSNAELVARVGALLRRRRPGRPELRYEDARIAVDFRERSVRADGREVQLSSTEWSLLTVLLRHPDEFLSPRSLLELVWGDPLGIGPERVKYSVLRLRRRLGWSDPETSPIESRRGAGYRYRRQTGEAAPREAGA
jgi:DNA-binding response OmpR family regulator